MRLPNALVVRFAAAPLGFSLWAFLMYSDPALLVLSIVGTQRAARLIAAFF